MTTKERAFRKLWSKVWHYDGLYIPWEKVIEFTEGDEVFYDWLKRYECNQGKLIMRKTVTDWLSGEIHLIEQNKYK